MNACDELDFVRAERDRLQADGARARALIERVNNFCPHRDLERALALLPKGDAALPVKVGSSPDGIASTLALYVDGGGI